MCKFALPPKFMRCLYIPIFTLFTLFASAYSYAQGNLLVSPKRIVFEGNKKTYELNLANTGTDTARYLISTKEIRMTEDGAFEEIIQPDSGQNFASGFIRIFPRAVAIPPNVAQTVKVQLTKANQLKPGEYRSHIYFRATPEAKALGEKDVVNDTAISVQLTPVFGITIPVIIRVGASNTTVKFSDMKMDIVNDTIPRFTVVMHRDGNMSTYGDVLVEHTSPDGKITPVGIARGVALYTPNAKRNFSFDLYKNTKVNFKKGSLRAVYVPDAKNGAIKDQDKKSIMADAVLVLQ